MIAITVDKPLAFCRSTTPQPLYQYSQFNVCQSEFVSGKHQQTCIYLTITSHFTKCFLLSWNILCKPLLRPSGECFCRHRFPPPSAADTKAKWTDKWLLLHVQIYHRDISVAGNTHQLYIYTQNSCIHRKIINHQFNIHLTQPKNREFCWFSPHFTTGSPVLGSHLATATSRGGCLRLRLQR